MGVVSTLSVSTVAPATPTLPNNRVHKLSNLDLHVSFDYYTKQVYYFPPPPPGDPGSGKPIKEIASSLKESLSQALVLFNVFAGRVRENGPRLEIECNDRGVPFLVATTDASFSDWEDLTRCPIEHDLNPAETYITNPVDSPLLKFQLTRFKCGGLALGIVTAELILDGSSYFEFMRSWSEIHKGASPQDVTPPIFDSSLLKARQPPQITIPVRDYTSSPKPGTEIAGKSSHDHHSAPAQPTLVKLFEMDPQQVDSLVREVQSGPFGFDTPTSFEATCAMIWKAMTEARGLPDSTLTTYVYAISLKAKNRWNPRIPSGYIGNSAHSPCLSVRAGEIKSNHVSYVARLFRQDIRSTTAEHIQSAIDWMEVEINRGRKINFNCDFVSGTGVYSTSLHTFPVYGVDLGLGSPVHYSLVMQPWYGNGVAIVLPTPKGGRSRRLLVSLPQEEMRKLCDHELFQKFTTAVL